MPQDKRPPPIDIQDVGYISRDLPGQRPTRDADQGSGSSLGMVNRTLMEQNKIIASTNNRITNVNRRLGDQSKILSLIATRIALTNVLLKSSFEQQIKMFNLEKLRVHQDSLKELTMQENEIESRKANVATKSMLTREKKALDNKKSKGGLFGTGIGAGIGGSLLGGAGIAGLFNKKVRQEIFGRLIRRGLFAGIITMFSDQLADALLGPEAEAEIKKQVSRSLEGGAIGLIFGRKFGAIGAALGFLLNDEIAAKLKEIAVNFTQLFDADVINIQGVIETITPILKSIQEFLQGTILSGLTGINNLIEGDLWEFFSDGGQVMSTLGLLGGFGLIFSRGLTLSLAVGGAKLAWEGIPVFFNTLKFLGLSLIRMNPIIASVLAGISLVTGGFLLLKNHIDRVEEETREKLEKEGLFNESHRLPTHQIKRSDFLKIGQSLLDENKIPEEKRDMFKAMLESQSGLQSEQLLSTSTLETYGANFEDLQNIKSQNRDAMLMQNPTHSLHHLAEESLLYRPKLDDPRLSSSYPGSELSSFSAFQQHNSLLAQIIKDESKKTSSSDQLPSVFTQVDNSVTSVQHNQSFVGPIARSINFPDQIDFASGLSLGLGRTGM